MDLRGFQKPDNTLRPCPFWAINDRITSEEAARQMRDMIRVGLSGGFFHSRHGLTTKYMGDEWFDAMKAALDVAIECDGYLWLYDEDLWPSGNAGGQIAGMKDEYRAASLNATLIPAGEPLPEMNCDQELRRCYAVQSRDGLQIKSIADISLDQIESAVDYERLLLVRSYAPKTAWWSGESYSNLLHPQAMAQFVKMTHEVYYEKFGREFGKRIPGIFTDEPLISNSKTGIAWFEGIPEIYNNWTGRDFWADMPYMYFEGQQSRKIRLLVHRTLLKQFVEAYSKPNYNWCEAHGLKYTGHYVAEDSFDEQIMYHSGSVMAHYRHMHIPGIDHLCRQTQGFLHISGMLITVKQASSAARQLGRTQVLDEIFGVSRHTSTFEDFKWLGDYDLVLGANFFVPHLSWYSAKGRRKRDYPPDWNYQQTYWNDLNPLNDYFTRVAHALTRGRAAVEIVMLHSIESATAARSLGVDVHGTIQCDIPSHNMQAAKELDDQMRKALDAILTAGYDCDLGDEGYIEDMGRIRGNNFEIGNMSYKLVVIPPSTTWRPRTFDLLKEFVASGGEVVVLGELPVELDCEDAHQLWRDFAKSANVHSIACGIAEIQNLMDEIASNTFTLKGVDGRAVPDSYVQRRIDGDQEIYFIVNSSRDATRNYVLTLIGANGKHLYQWDAVTGKCDQLSGRTVGEDLRLEFSLPPCGSILLVLGGEIDGCTTHDSPRAKEYDVTVLPLEFDFERADPNVLVLDRMSVSYDGGRSFEPETLEHRVRQDVLAHFGTEALLKWQPWVAEAKHLFECNGGKIVLRYRFMSDLDRPKSYVVIEDIAKGRLHVNGMHVNVSGADWHWDRGFGKVEITSFVRKGENLIDFTIDYDYLTEVEPAYIVGDFGVDLADPCKGRIVQEPKSLRTGSWISQGYPFYTGRMIYKTSIQIAEVRQTILRMLRPSGTLFKVSVNVQKAGAILWRPYELDISKFLNPGTNQVEVEVVSSMQNAWGPMHEKIGDDSMWCGPNAFEDDCWLRDELNVFPYGLLGGLELYIAR